MEYTYINGQTPLDEDAKKGLKIPAYTKEDLNRAEELNIIEGLKWGRKKRNLSNDIFTEKFLLRLHKEMFGHVWKWAGTYRETNMNIGSDKTTIRQDLFILFEEVEYWFKESKYSINEIAVMFHHRLVKIHLFPNGNGRHARLCADLIILKYDGKKLSWANMDLRSENDVRDEYIQALKKADA